MTEQRKHAILLVDDEPDILFSLQGLLRREFDLYVAESGDEALKILSEHPIDVVMTDQRMPKMSGVELMGHVKSQHPEAIRIVFTGYADIKAVVEAINEGGLYRYITKPWDPDELVTMLHEACEKHDRMVERRELLANLRDFIALGREVAGSVLQASRIPADQAERARRFMQTGADLLPRLEQAIELAAEESDQ